MAASFFAMTLACSGCAVWNPPKFDLNRFRDPRAIDIDDRLSSPPPKPSAEQSKN